MHSLYIHVPFCQKRCHYCSFYSTTFGKRERDLYVQALLQEIEARHTDDVITTVYFGGGTPSQLDSEELTTIFGTIRRNYNIAPDAEITFECNPDDVDDGMRNTSNGITTLPTLLASLGVNRVSMGVQSFDDEMLQRINRRHTAAQALDAIHAFHAAGIHNVSIDLIYGLPGQTLDDFRRDVEKAAHLASGSWSPETSLHHVIGDKLPNKSPLITHLSSYCLSIEEGTHLYNLRARGELTETDEETTLAMYNVLIDSLTAAGFVHYEISNFALPSFHSRHNTAYWQGIPYTGLGPGAHSYDGIATRRWNRSDLRSYLADPLGSYDDEHLSPSECYDELIMTRLRTRDGLSLSLLSAEEQKYLLRQARPYIASGHLCIDEGSNSLRLTRQGIFISDMIFSDLMSEF